MATCYKCDRCGKIQDERLTKLSILPASNIDEEDYHSRKNASRIAKVDKELCPKCVELWEQLRSFYFTSIGLKMEIQL